MENLIQNPILIFTIGALFVSSLVYLFMPSMMILKKKSSLSFDETVKKISENIKKEGWSLMGVERIDESIKKHGRKTGVKVALINMCQADYATAIVSDPKASHISVMMPCTISVYQNTKGEVFTANMNTKPMGWMFGGIVRKIMSGPVAKAQKKFLELKS